MVPKRRQGKGCVHDIMDKTQKGSYWHMKCSYHATSIGRFQAPRAVSTFESLTNSSWECGCEEFVDQVCLKAPFMIALFEMQ